MEFAEFQCTFSHIGPQRFVLDRRKRRKKPFLYKVIEEEDRDVWKKVDLEAMPPNHKHLILVTLGKLTMAGKLEWKQG